MTAAARRRGRLRSGLPAAWALALVVWQLVLPTRWDVANVAAAEIGPADDSADEDENPYRPGVLAQYASSAGGAEFSRLEDEIVLAASRPPDARIPAGPFRAVFNARVLVQSPGVHRLRIYAAGQISVTLAGKRLLDASSAAPAWLDAESVELPFGYQPLRVEYESGERPARLSLFWEGPGFALEPLAARWLFHEHAKTPADDFERGGQLVRALRCAACHELGEPREALAAPALDRLRGNISPDWIVERLSAANEQTSQSGNSQKMPHFALTTDEAQAISDYLMTASAETPPSKVVAPPPRQTETSKTKSKVKPKVPNAADGATLVHSLGCLACHRIGELGSDGLFGGGDLSQIAAKRPASFFARWLIDPAALNRHHRMPVFALDALEVANLSLYLESLGKWPAPTLHSDNNRVARGAELVRQYRCGSCHRLPGGRWRAVSTGSAAAGGARARSCLPARS